MVMNNLDYKDYLNLYYSGNDLGAIYSKDKTCFRVWSPAADQVSVVIYNEGIDNFSIEPVTYDKPRDEAGTEYEMQKDVNGLWYAEVEQDLENKLYMFKVTISGSVRETVDPYARGLCANGKRSVVVNLKNTDPDGWEGDSKPLLQHPTDAIIYEIHIRDFTISPASGVNRKGKYTGFAEAGTRNPEGYMTGIDHLKELGVTHVQLLPVMDFSSVDEVTANTYNWGYDPFHYFVPEGVYSSDPQDAAARIKELKQMISELHSNGIGVIMDVVYNHTHVTESSPFDILAPKYYYRTDESGTYTDGSGCRNETASERPMVKKLMLDSLKYWVEEYHIDGFRFDLMGLHDIDTMIEIEKQLHNMDRSILIYGEPWIGGTSGLEESKRFGKGSQAGNNIAVFNDNIRDAVKGSTRGSDGGFIADNPCGSSKLDLLRGITGEINYSEKLRGFAVNPGETINYCSCHDDLCLWDKIINSNPEAAESDIIKMHLLANTIVLTSQGIPFMHGGDELLRTKHGVENSYCSGDHINMIDWERKSRYPDVFQYYKGLIKLRKSHPAFRIPDAESVCTHLEFIETGYEDVVAFLLKNHANGDSWKDIAVIFNASREEKGLALHAGQWEIAADSSKLYCSCEDTLKTIHGGAITVPAVSAIIAFCKA